jgi:hypothetical protein
MSLNLKVDLKVNLSACLDLSFIPHSPFLARSVMSSDCPLPHVFGMGSASYYRKLGLALSRVCSFVVAIGVEEHVEHDGPGRCDCSLVWNGWHN